MHSYYKILFSYIEHSYNRRMKEKFSGKSDTTARITGILNHRTGGDLSDATRLYRKE